MVVGDAGWGLWLGLLRLLALWPAYAVTTIISSRTATISVDGRMKRGGRSGVRSGGDNSGRDSCAS